MHPTETESEFTLTSPDDIRSALFELTHAESRIGVRDAADREIAVELVAIEKRIPRFYWRPRDYAGGDFANGDRQALLAGDSFRFVAQGYGGVLVRFAVSRPEVVHDDDGQPALASPFPEHLTRIQRRKSFRAVAPGRMGATARWRPEGAPRPIVMSVRDISIDGLGLRVEQPLTMLPAVGTTLSKVSLDLGEDEPLVVDLLVRSAYALGRQDEADAEDAAGSQDGADPAQAEAGKAQAKTGMAPAEIRKPQTEVAKTLSAGTAMGWAQPLSHLGTLFVNLDNRQQSRLQQIVWRLEKSRASL